MSGMHRVGDAATGMVLALHSSASTGSQWQKLAVRMAAEARVEAPDLWGFGAAPPWSAARPFTLADDAARAIDAIPAEHRDRFDLVGHSYGGGVALHIARHHPDRVRSMVLIEPVAFHLLFNAPVAVRCEDAIAEARSLGETVANAVERGEHAHGMAHFIDYWNGAGSWERLAAEPREALAARLPQVNHNFSALIGEPGGLQALRAVRCPVLVLRGAKSPRPARLIAAMLACSLPRAELATLGDAGHMLAVTHAAKCNELIRWHLANTGTALPGRAA